MNVPTVIFWNPNDWQLRDSAIPFFDMLKLVGILHDTPKSAADHINAIWEDVGLWWESDILQCTLETFKRRYCDISNGSIVTRINDTFKEITEDCH